MSVCSDAEARPPPDLGELKGVVNAPLGFSRPNRLDDERDVQLGGALRDRDDVDLRGRERVEDACGDARGPCHPEPDDGDGGEAAQDLDAVDLPARDFLAKRLEKALPRRVGLRFRDARANRVLGRGLRDE